MYKDKEFIITMNNYLKRYNHCIKEMDRSSAMGIMYLDIMDHNSIKSHKLKVKCHININLILNKSLMS